jgi:hypothetical protein
MATEDEIHQVMQLVTGFLLDKPQYDSDAILSFHRGKWYQQNFKHFHAHLCVARKAYCQEAKLQVAVILIPVEILYLASPRSLRTNVVTSGCHPQTI